LIKSFALRALDRLNDLRCSPPASSRDVASTDPVGVLDGDELGLAAWLVDLLGDRGPDQPLLRQVGRAGFAADAEHGTDGLADGLAVAAVEDDRRGAVAGDVGARGVDDVGEVDLVARYSSMSFLPNSRFMNEFAVIIPTNPACPASIGVAARSKNRSVNGTPSEYCRWQVGYRSR
jgi:hypothetical protein